jgi:hypothetical protein
MPKVVGLTAVFSSIHGLMMRPFAEHILFYFWKTQTQHFIARKQSSKQTQNKYLFTYLHFIVEFNSPFIFVISLDYVMHLIIY